MTHRRRRPPSICLALFVAVGYAALTGCGSPAEAPPIDSGVVTTTSPSVTGTPSTPGPPRRPGSPSVPGTPSSSAPPALHPPAGHHENPGDAWARRNAGNNGWKRRYELSPKQQRIADTAATRLRPKLRELRAEGDFSKQALRKALVESGLEPIDVVTDTDPGDEQPARVLFWSAPRSGVCVDGKLTAETVVVRTEGPSLDGGCRESGGGH